jgi:hypothetical protein
VRLMRPPSWEPQRARAPESRGYLVEQEVGRLMLWLRLGAHYRSGTHIVCLLNAFDLRNGVAR